MLLDLFELTVINHLDTSEAHYSRTGFGFQLQLFTFSFHSPPSPALPRSDQSKTNGHLRDAGTSLSPPLPHCKSTQPLRPHFSNRQLLYTTCRFCLPHLPLALSHHQDRCTLPQLYLKVVDLFSFASVHRNHTWSRSTPSFYLLYTHA